jgi:hypothetical protein
MEDFYKKKGWHWPLPKRVGDKWLHNHYQIEVKRKYSDGAYQEIVFTMKQTPGLVGKVTNREPLKLGYEHKFSIILPREYPANLSHIKMRALTRLWHPRIAMSGSGDACITVNGEIDRILVDLIYHILMDPKRIRPPKLYPKEDSGMNAAAMRWFESDAENIHKLLLTKWSKRHEKASFAETGGIKIIGAETSDDPQPKKNGAIKIMTKEAEQKPEEEQKKKRDKAGGVKIL